MGEEVTVTDDEKHNRNIDLTAQVVSAFLSNNSVPAGDVPTLIEQVHGALLDAERRGAGEITEPLEPAVPIKKSVQPDYIICLEDGKQFKQLKRHLRNAYGMTPDEYRAKWGLPYDYPMVAPNYSKARSELAKNIGLGRKPAESRVASKPAPAHGGRTRKTTK